MRWQERLIGDWHGDGMQMGTGFLFGNGIVLVGSYGFWGHKTFGVIAAECSRLLGGLGGLGVRDREELAEIA